MQVKIDCWYYGHVTAPNGVATFLRYFKNKTNNIHGVGFEIFSLDRDQNNKEVTKGRIKNEGIKALLKDKIMRLALFIPMASYFFLKKAFIDNAREVVDKYGESDSNAVLFFQDFFTCYEYFSKYKDSLNESVIVLHSDGDPLNMIYKTYPFLKKSKKAIKYLEKIVEYSLRKVSRIVFLSQRARSTFFNDYPQYDKKSRVVYNGLDDVPINKPNFNRNIDSKIRIVSVGTVGERKGFDILIDAFMSLPTEVQNCYELNIVGDGPLVNKLVHKCENQKNVIFLGKRDDVDNILAEMDVFLLVSRDEGMPMAVIEAMRQGKPLFLTNVGGMGEMVKQGENGWLVDPNKENILKGLIKMAQEKDKIGIYAMNSRERFLSEFQGMDMIHNYLDIFSNLSCNAE
ncbi:hypothetical protein DN752_19945 [Echinicola strongylocentroti]|uniref:Glycosyl transferase family 1 domain-containing protein n=1 Tax=Echinicola strongylocentroti TaxID=1795355 RepID=A0A2Z4INI7_9BACT|nr:glycosyltransferase family 4 protein [Echinicola strongylocentroti]AWW32228.1 hypothetical protein DN752_19945 [Echinicola strongylocentroti]